MIVVTCPTPEYHGYNIKFSPFSADLFACAASKNYGLSGPGAVLIFKRVPGKEEYIQTHTLEWHDGIFDLSWSKGGPNILASCSGDGTIQIWNTMHPKEKPGRLPGHSKEVYGIDWCQVMNVNFLLSASSDESVRLWDAMTKVEVSRFLGHENIVYSALWSPDAPEVFASVGGEGALKVWDVRFPQMIPHNVMAHNGDALACDWSRLNQHVIATGGVDKAIQIWDLRNPLNPLQTLLGHEFAVRRVKFSRYHPDVLASVSYDFTTCLWNWSSGCKIDTYSYHTEFAYGLDFSNHDPDVMIDCAWDSLIQIYKGINFE